MSEDLIYILIGVAWVVYSLFAAGKKAKKAEEARKKNASQKQEDFTKSDVEEQEKVEYNNTRGTTIEDIFNFENILEKENTKQQNEGFENLETILDEEEEIEKELQRQKELRKRFNVIEKTESLEDLGKGGAINKKFERASDKDISKMALEQNINDANKTELTYFRDIEDYDFDNQLIEDFDLKKAIVYHEIMKRPYD